LDIKEREGKEREGGEREREREREKALDSFAIKCVQEIPSFI